MIISGNTDANSWLLVLVVPLDRTCHHSSKPLLTTSVCCPVIVVLLIQRSSSRLHHRLYCLLCYCVVFLFVHSSTCDIATLRSSFRNSFFFFISSSSVFFFFLRMIDHSIMQCSSSFFILSTLPVKITASVHVVVPYGKRHRFIDT